MEGVEKEIDFEFLDSEFLSDEEEDQLSKNKRLNPNGLGFIDKDELEDFDEDLDNNQLLQA